MEWTNWNYVNLFFAVVNTWLAISFWKEGNLFAGHLNAFAGTLNSVIVVTRLGL